MSSRSSPAPPSSPWRVNIQVEAWSPHFLFCRGRIFVQDVTRDADQDDDGTTTTKRTTTLRNNGSSPVHTYLRPNEPVIAFIDEEALRKKLVQKLYQRSSSSTSEFSSLHRDHYSNADYSSGVAGGYGFGSYVDPGAASTHTKTSSNATYSSGENIGATLLQPDTLISVHYSHVFPVPSGVDGSHAEHDELRPPGEVQENLQTASRASSSSLLSQLESTVAGLELLARLPVGALEEDMLLVANHRAAMGVVRALEVVRRAGFDAGVAGASSSDSYNSSSSCGTSGAPRSGTATSSPRLYQTAGLTILTESGSSFAEELQLRQEAAQKFSSSAGRNDSFLEVVELPRRINNNSPGEIQQRAENTAGGGSGIITSATSSNSALLIPESLQTRRFKTILYCGLNLESGCRDLSSTTSSSSTPAAEHNPSFVRQLFALLSSFSTEQHRNHFYHSGFTPASATFVVLTRSFELAPIECQYLISKNVSLLFHRCFGSSGSTSGFGASAGAAMMELVKKALYNDKAFLSSCTNTNTPKEEAKHDDHHATYQERSLRQFSFEDASTEVWHCG